MIQITAIHLVGTEGLQHIEALRWIPVAQPGGAATGAAKESTREQMVTFVRANTKGACAMNSAGTHYAFLEVVEAQPPYVKTVPDATKSDNLLSLPTF